MILHPTWRFIDSGRGTASWNMAVDESLLSSYSEGDLPIIRLYGWENSLSLGRFSTLSATLDPEKLAAEHLPFVRRMSGGGVLVHGGDLSYALILPRDRVNENGVKESYRYLCRFLLNVYHTLGYEGCFAADIQLQTNRSDSCLAAFEAYDIVINGKKMGGNAQRYTRHGLLQHGSIPMRFDESKFVSLFRGDSGLQRAASLQRLGVAMESEQLITLVKEVFCETYQVTLVCDTLTFAEENRAQELAAQKYTQERWNRHGQFATA